MVGCAWPDDDLACCGACGDGHAQAAGVEWEGGAEDTGAEDGGAEGEASSGEQPQEGDDGKAMVEDVAEGVGKLAVSEVGGGGRDACQGVWQPALLIH